MDHHSTDEKSVPIIINFQCTKCGNLKKLNPEDLKYCPSPNANKRCIYADKCINEEKKRVLKGRR